MKKIFGLILISGAIFIFPLKTSGGVMPGGLKEYEFIYDRLERFEVRTGGIFNYPPGLCRLDNENLVLTPFDYLRNIPPEKIRLFSFLAEDFRATKDLRSHGYETFQAGIVGQPLRTLFVYGHFVLDEEKAEDDNYTGKKWRGFAGDVEEAFIHFQNGSFGVTAGRFGSFWGLRNSLVLTADRRLDGFGYSFRWGKLVISYRLARLDGLSPERDNVAAYENRFLAGHRFDFHFSRRLQVGLFETVVFGGPGRTIDLFYLNPLIFFHGAQLNEHANDNTMVGCDFTFHLRPGCRLYGQLLVDDIQLDDKEQSDQEPDEWAVLVGGQTAAFLLPVDIRLEYTRVSNWMFNQILPRNRYLFHDDPFGGVRGNDYDLSRLVVSRWWGKDFRMDGEVSYYRQGEGRVTARWSEPWLDTEGAYTEKFPTGTVEKTFRGALAFKGFIRNMFYFDLTAGIDRVGNYRHIGGENKTRPFFNLVVSTFVSFPVNLH